MIKRLTSLLALQPRSKPDSSLSSLEATHSWIAQSHGLPKLDAHHRITDLLEQYIKLNDFSNSQLIHILALIEHAGSKLQYTLIKQFFQNQVSPQATSYVNWPEIVNFYRLLSIAYQQLAWRDANLPKPGAMLPTTVLRALHYQGKLMQWGYLRFEPPTPAMWHTLHTLYRVTLQHGFSENSMVLKGSTFASCKDVYTSILLLHLMHPVGLEARDIELAAYLSWKLRDHINLSEKFDANVHTHCIALNESNPPQSLPGRVHGNGPIFYWSTIQTLIQLRKLLADKENSLSTEIKLYGVPYTADQSDLLQHIMLRLSGKTQLKHDMARLPESVEMLCCASTVVKLLIQPQSGSRIRAKVIPIGHPDETCFQLSITEDVSNCRIAINQMIIIDAPEFTAPLLCVIRWIEQKGVRLITLGMERIGAAPRLTTFHPINDPALPSPAINDNDDGCVAIIVAEPISMLVFNAIQERYADIREDGLVFRVRLRSPLEQNSQWLLLPFTKLTRTLCTVTSENGI